MNFSLYIERAFAGKEEVLAAFLDVQGTFDNFNADILLSKLAKSGCPTNLCQFVKFSMTERQVYTNVSESKYMTTRKGVPQGGALTFSIASTLLQ